MFDEFESTEKSLNLKVQFENQQKNHCNLKIIVCFTEFEGVVKKRKSIVCFTEFEGCAFH